MCVEIATSITNSFLWAMHNLWDCRQRLQSGLLSVPLLQNTSKSGILRL